MRKLRIAIISIVIAASLPACKKDSKNNPDPNPTPTTGTRLELSLDSLYLYARETYLWYDAIPDITTFNPRSYAGTDDFTSLQAELYKISQYKINPTTSQPYEYVAGASRPKYSFVEKGNAARGIKGSVDLEGQGNDFGLGLVIVNSSAVYVRLVEKGSTSDQAGITRGCKVLTVNGATASTDAATLNAALAGSTLNLTLRKPDGTNLTANLNKGTYTNDPVYTYKIFPANGINITGYVNLARFSRLSNAQPTLDKAFTDFKNAGVNNLVIDLRYNGGGYVQTAQYLCNLIGPSTLSGKVMYKELFNNLLQNGNAPILKSIPYLDANNQQVYQNGRALTYADLDYTEKGNTITFEKKGSLGDNIRNVVFIVSGSTASASELTINALKPYLNVKLVAASTGSGNNNTYGKPVGFFGIGIDKFTVYMSQFTSVNSNGEGNYFAGFPPDMVGYDDPTRDFGDPLENALSKALAYINTGIIGRTTDRVMLANGRVLMDATTISENVGAEGFNGMIEERRKIK